MMKKIKRKSNWPEILADELTKAKSRSFKYGSHDCCMFSNRIIRAGTGTNIAKRLQGYKDAAGAVRMLKKNGQGTLFRTMTAIMKEHGCPEIKNTALLRRMDVCIAKIKTPEGKVEFAVGICIGRDAAFASDGVVTIPISEVTKGWHCG